MNACELYNHVFDSANEYKKESVKYIKEYAENVFGIIVQDDVATIILECKAALDCANDNNGNWENNYYYHVRAPLENIEL